VEASNSSEFQTNAKGEHLRQTLNALISTPVSALLSIGQLQPEAGHGAVVGQFVCCVFWSAPSYNREMSRDQ
jgi:hypothetical protein